MQIGTMNVIVPLPVGIYVKRIAYFKVNVQILNLHEVPIDLFPY